MAMTKEEVIKGIHNHSGEIKTINAAIEFTLISLKEGYKSENPGELDALMAMTDKVKDLATVTKRMLGQWPSL